MTTARDAIVCPSVSAPAGDLSVTVLDSLAALTAHREEWDGFVERAGSDIYFTVGWLETWWKFYGQNRLLRCFLIRNNVGVVAALPFAIGNVLVGPFRTRLARFVGADSTIVVLLPAIERGFEPASLRKALDHLIRTDRCDAVRLSPLSGRTSLVPAIKQACEASGAYRLVRGDKFDTHIHFELPENFDAYLAGLPKQARSNFRRDLRRLSERCELAHRVLRGSDIVSRFDAFVEMHRAQWVADGRLGHFDDWPQGGLFNRAVVERLSRDGRVRLFETYGNGRLLASQFGYILANRFYWRLPARSLDPHLEKMGLGRVALVKMVEELIAEGVRTIEAGPGRYEYKLRHGGTEYALERLIIARHNRWSLARVRLAILASQVINFVYYRIWYLRLARRVGISRPLWSGWIQTRL